ncbi:hypothetical protein DXG01_000848, partial [Tephrocybe rancida]
MRPSQLYRLALTILAAEPSPPRSSEAAAEDGIDTNDELEQHADALEELDSMRSQKEHG